MRVDEFDFDLPDAQIALRPAVPRTAARLLHVQPGAGSFNDLKVLDLPGLMRAGDVFVLNDTRVIPARLFGLRQGRGGTTPKIEVTLHKRETATKWHAFCRPARKIEPGDKIRFGHDDRVLLALVEAKGEGGEVTLVFECPPGTFDARLAAVGTIPLPPYIAAKRAVDEDDRSDYQTVYARDSGAVAAPTAGLHLTEDLLKAISNQGVAIETLTLHVGAGTFLPVKSETTGGHKMHAEWGSISKDTADRINAARDKGGRLIACGTTSLRLLESAAKADGRIAPFSGDTDIFITPGYRFRAVDALLTNFHLPRSTLFMLVCALCGFEVMKDAYSHAISNGYRFYSYGDASFLERA